MDSLEHTAIASGCKRGLLRPDQELPLHVLDLPVRCLAGNAIIPGAEELGDRAISDVEAAEDSFSRDEHMAGITGRVAVERVLAIDATTANDRLQDSLAGMDETVSDPPAHVADPCKGNRHNLNESVPPKTRRPNTGLESSKT